jgi:hypothetical protein
VTAAAISVAIAIIIPPAIGAHASLFSPLKVKVTEETARTTLN